MQCKALHPGLIHCFINESAGITAIIALFGLIITENATIIGIIALNQLECVGMLYLTMGFIALKMQFH